MDGKYFRSAIKLFLSSKKGISVPRACLQNVDNAISVFTEIIFDNIYVER